MKYIHVSFDEVHDFIPRVPKTRLFNEDGITKRICVTPDIKHSLSAVPGILRIISGLNAIGYEPVVHTYTLDINAAYVRKDLSDLVPDSDKTKEAWLLKEPDKIIRQDYRWHCPDAKINHTKDNIVVPYVTGTFEKIEDTDGILDFIDFARVDDALQALYDIIKKRSLGTLLRSLDKSLSYCIQKNREEYQKGVGSYDR